MSTSRTRMSFEGKLREAKLVAGKMDYQDQPTGDAIDLVLQELVASSGDRHPPFCQYEVGHLDS